MRLSARVQLENLLLVGVEQTTDDPVLLLERGFRLRRRGRRLGRLGCFGCGRGCSRPPGCSRRAGRALSGWSIRARSRGGADWRSGSSAQHSGRRERGGAGGRGRRRGKNAPEVADQRLRDLAVAGLDLKLLGRALNNHLAIDPAADRLIVHWRGANRWNLPIQLGNLALELAGELAAKHGDELHALSEPTSDFIATLAPVIAARQCGTAGLSERPARDP